MKWKKCLSLLMSCDVSEIVFSQTKDTEREKEMTAATQHDPNNPRND